MTIKKFTIFGERCSGTNYLEKIITKNFYLEITWQYGWKHFFGFNDLSNSDDTLFICIVRNQIDWINSFYNSPHHLPQSLTLSIENFLNNEFYSLNEHLDYIEIKEDRNIYTFERYKNIFELRNTKLKFMIEDLPNKVKNYILIRYEDLLNNFNDVMENISKFDVTKKYFFFINDTENDFKYGGKLKKKINKKNVITDDMILNHSDFNKKYEEQLNYM